MSKDVLRIAWPKDYLTDTSRLVSEDEIATVSLFKQTAIELVFDVPSLLTGGTRTNGRVRFVFESQEVRKRTTSVVRFARIHYCPLEKRSDMPVAVGRDENRFVVNAVGCVSPLFPRCSSFIGEKGSLIPLSLGDETPGVPLKSKNE